MIPIEVINSLEEKELDFVLYLLNNVSPCGIPVSKETLKCFRMPFLAKRISEAKGKVSEEGAAVFNSVCEKLKISI